jgi:heme/copper-type cytochrome/quinol oxidase subunit 3
MKLIFKDITRATGIGFCISQLPLTIFIILYYKEPKTIIYNCEITNITSFQYKEFHDEVGISVFFLAVSCLIVFFAMLTTQLEDAQMIDNLVEFNEDIATQLSSWNNLLLIISSLQRVVVMSLLLSPVLISFLLLNVLAQTFALALLCLPRTSYKKNDTMALFIYMSTLGSIFFHLQTTHGTKMVVWFIQIIADLLLIVGHTHDTISNMETIANCRIFFCCFVSSLLILLYIA